MLKYIKWELKDFFKKQWKMGIFVIAITILMLILINTNTTSETLIGLISVPFFFMILYLLLMMFIQGTRLVVNTFRKKTYLLESMISYSPSKILLAKYLIAIILNVMYGVILFIILWLLLLSSDVNIIKEIAKIIGEIGVLELLKVIILIVVYSLTFTSLVTMVYIIAKCINPNKKGTIITSVIIWWIVIFLQNTLLNSIVGELEYDNTMFILTIIINTAFILIYYFVSVKLIKDKLEIYT